MISTNTLKDKIKRNKEKLSKNNQLFFQSPKFIEWVSQKLYFILQRMMGCSAEQASRLFPVQIIYLPEGTVAYTEGKTCTVNAGCDFVQSSSDDLWKKAIVVLGLAIHELGHRLYTNFEFSMHIEDGVANGELYPKPYVEYSKLDALISSKKYPQSLPMIMHQIFNAMEDGYIENRMIDEFEPHHVKPLIVMREAFLEHCGCLNDELEAEKNGQHIFLSILALLLLYAEYGVLACEKNQYDDERIKKVIMCIPYIDACNSSYDTWEHYRAMVNVVALLQDEIVDYLESHASDEEAKQEIEQKTGAEQTAHDGSSQPLMGDGTNYSSMKSKESTMDRSQMMAPTAPSENYEYTGTRYIDADPVTEADMRELQAQVSSVTSSIATAEAIVSEETELVKELRTIDSSISYGALHTGVSTDIIRKPIVTEDMKNAYNALFSEPLRISDLMIKNYIKAMKDKAHYNFQKGKYFGQRFVPQATVRLDKKYFGSMQLPSLPTLSVGLLIDCSGSMHGDRIASARSAAVILENFVRNVGGRCCIVGHEEAGARHVKLHCYADYNSIDNNDRYRLMDIKSGSRNRDGYALKYMLERLKKEQSDIKVLILISDGQPNGDGYKGRTAYEDLKALAKEAKRSKVNLIAAAVGDDKEIIKNIYGTSFLDITNMNSMPKDFVRLLQRYLPE